MALSIGVADPLGLLERAGPDWDIAVAVIERAQTIDMERRHSEVKALVDGIGNNVGNRVGEVLARSLRAMFG